VNRGQEYQTVNGRKVNMWRFKLGQKMGLFPLVTNGNQVKQVPQLFPLNSNLQTMSLRLAKIRHIDKADVDNLKAQQDTQEKNILFDPIEKEISLQSTEESCVGRKSLNKWISNKVRERNKRKKKFNKSIDILRATFK